MSHLPSEEVEEWFTNLLNSQRRFLIAGSHCFRAAIEHPEKYPTTNLSEYFEQAWSQIWKVNEIIASKMELHLMTVRDIKEETENVLILNDMPEINLEKLYNG